MGSIVVPIEKGKPTLVKSERHPAFTYKGALNPYRSYNFVDKDPVIDEVRKVVEDSNLSYSKISEMSGVSATTLSNWFYGSTKKPQNATVEAVLRALGHRRVVTKD